MIKLLDTTSKLLHSVMNVANLVNSGEAQTNNVVGNPEPSLGNKEGATTIPKGSRAQAIGVRSAWHPTSSAGGDDIVWSIWKHIAALIGGLGLANLSEQ